MKEDPRSSAPASEAIGFRELRQACEISALREELERLRRDAEALCGHVEDVVTAVRDRFADLTPEELANAASMLPLLQLAVTELISIRDHARQVDLAPAALADEARSDWNPTDAPPVGRPPAPRSPVARPADLSSSERSPTAPSAIFLPGLPPRSTATRPPVGDAAEFGGGDAGPSASVSLPAAEIPPPGGPIPPRLSPATSPGPFDRPAGATVGAGGGNDGRAPASPPVFTPPPAFPSPPHSSPPSGVRPPLHSSPPSGVRPPPQSSPSSGVRPPPASLPEKPSPPSAAIDWLAPRR